jgi:hypothetical protein
LYSTRVLGLRSTDLQAVSQNVICYVEKFYILTASVRQTRGYKRACTLVHAHFPWLCTLTYAYTPTLRTLMYAWARGHRGGPLV